MIVRLFLGALFIYAAVPKIMDPFAFAVDVYNYRLLPGFAVGLVAAALPWLELAAGCLLVLGVRVRAAAVIITCLLAVFTLAMLINTVRGIDVHCGCFTSDRAIGWRAVTEDTVFTLLGIWYITCGKNFFCLENVLKKPFIQHSSV